MMKFKLILLFGLLLLWNTGFSQNPNFHIYICFGQSNMEGVGPIETVDRTVNSRFKVLQAIPCTNLNRQKEKWYSATPPLCQCYSGLSVSDYFGRTMVANLPDSITVGVVNVAIGGCDIRLFDKDIYQNYDSTYKEAWFQDKIKAYGGNPYEYLINLVKLAQKDGVVKGILLHQGETNTGDTKWPGYVNTIYTNMLTDLSLKADSVPILAGHVVSTAVGGCCGSMNPIIDKLPSTIPTSYVISSAGCAVQADKAHFTSEGYRIMGRRYAVKMLSLMGIEAVYTESECGVVGDSVVVRAETKASNGSYVTNYPGVTNSLTEAPTLSSNYVQMNFAVSKDTSYYVYGRFNNTGAGSNAYWVKTDNSDFILKNNLPANSWKWVEMGKFDMLKGNRYIQLALSGSGILLDKIVVKNSQILPVDFGEEAKTICKPKISTVDVGQFAANGYSLEQNYPNPFTGETSIAFEIPVNSQVSIKIFNILGVEVAELAGKEFIAGSHSLKLENQKLPAGSYYYKMKTDKYSFTRKMMVLAE